MLYSFSYFSLEVCYYLSLVRFLVKISFFGFGKVLSLTTASQKKYRFHNLLVGAAAGWLPPYPFMCNLLPMICGTNAFTRSAGRLMKSGWMDEKDSFVSTGGEQERRKAVVRRET